MLGKGSLTLSNTPVENRQIQISSIQVNLSWLCEHLNMGIMFALHFMIGESDDCHGATVTLDHGGASRAFHVS